MKRNSYLWFSVIMGIFVSLFSCVLPAAETAETSPFTWSWWRGENRDGLSPEKIMITRWEEGVSPVIWEATVGVGYSAVSVDGDRAYTLGRFGELDAVVCLNALTGEQLWRFDFTPTGKATPPGDEGPGSTPAVAFGKVYALGLNGEFFCLDATTGRELWSRKLMEQFGVKPCNYGFTGSPVILGSQVILDVGKTISFDKDTGNVLWETQDYGACYSTPMPFMRDQESLLAVFNATGLVIMSATEGKELFRQEWSVPGINNVNSTTPIIQNNLVFIGSAYEGGWGVIELWGEKKPPIIWRKQHESHMFATPVLLGGYLYGFDATTLVCMKMDTGEIQWSKRGLGKGTLISADGKLIILGENGVLAIAQAKADEYVELGRTKILAPICWALPSLSNGKLYCRNSKGRLVCVDLGGKR